MNDSEDIDLSRFSRERLEGELEQRRMRDAEAVRPKPVANPDFTALIECCEYGYKMAEEKGYVDDDLDHYIYEAAVDAVYGPNIFWVWLRKRFP